MAKRLIDEWRADVKTSRLPPVTRAIILDLSEYMNFDDLGNARPGPARLADRTGFSQATVKRHLKAAIEAGWIRQLWQGGSTRDGQRAASIYAGTWPKDHTRPVSERYGLAGQTRIRETREPVSERHTTLSLPGDAATAGAASSPNNNNCTACGGILADAYGLVSCHNDACEEHKRRAA